MINIQIALALVMVSTVARTMAIPILQSQPQLPKPPSPACQTLSFVIKTGEMSQTILMRSRDLPNQCMNVSTDLPTTVVLSSAENQETCQFQMIQHSQPACERETNDTRNALNLEVVLNPRERKSICSFELQSRPFNPAGHTWVTVKFTKGNGIPLHQRKVAEKDCFNICGGPYSTFYPDGVTVYQDDTAVVVEDNSIKLFSENNCEPDSDIKNANGDELLVRQEEDLATLTQIRPQRFVRSFKLERL